MMNQTSPYPWASPPPYQIILYNVSSNPNNPRSGDSSNNDSTYNADDNANLYEISTGPLILLSVLYGLISLLSILGNGCVIWIVTTRPRMRTVTNYFLLNLAVADMVIGMFSVPFQFQAALLQRWVLPKILCPLAPFVQTLCVTVSVLTLTVVALDRWSAVVRPLKARLLTTRRAKAILASFWVIAFASSLPMALTLRIIKWSNPPSAPENVKIIGSLNSPINDFHRNASDITDHIKHQYTPSPPKKIPPRSKRSVQDSSPYRAGGSFDFLYDNDTYDINNTNYSTSKFKRSSAPAGDTEGWTSVLQVLRPGKISRYLDSIYTKSHDSASPLLERNHPPHSVAPSSMMPKIAVEAAPPTRDICVPVWSTDVARKSYFIYLSLIQYFFPLSFMICVYTSIAINLWWRKVPGNAQDTRDALIHQNKMKVIKMLLIVVFMFAFCWLPLQTYNVLSEIISTVNEYQYINIIWFCCHWIAMSNSCVNPFVYGLYNNKFRSEFVRIYQRLLLRKRDGTIRRNTTRFKSYTLSGLSINDTLEGD